MDNLKGVCKSAFGTVVGLIGYFKKSNIKIKISAIAACLCFAAAGTVTACGLTMTYGVKYNGKIIGYVEKKEDVDTAVQAVVAVFKTQNPFDYIAEINCAPAFGTQHSVSSTESLKEAIIDNTEGMVKCTAFAVEDNTVLYVKDKAEIETVLSNRLAADTVSQGEAAFAEKISFSEVYCAKRDLADKEQIERSVSNLTVKNVCEITYNEEIDYNTVTREVSSRPVGYKKVYTKGKCGTKSITERVTYVNGVETERKIIAEKTVEKPTTELILVGTGTETVKKTSSAFIWPLEKKSGEYISAYFGDGRGHKGWDIATEKGTQIYAARGGKVTFAGWDSSGYGNLIIIDHGNGISTAYAHCEKLLVKAGDTVYAGKCIGLVGKTGRASGNHLHFEIRVNGKAVNPSTYY